jgi:hypothetical protein
MEHLLSMHQLRTAILFWDTSSPVYRTLAESGSFGPIHQLLQSRLSIMGRCEGWPEAAIQELCWRPKAISPIDL